MLFYKRLIISFLLILFSCDNNENLSVTTYSDILEAVEFFPVISLTDTLDFSSATSQHLYSGEFYLNGFYDSNDKYTLDIVSLINWAYIPSAICNYSLVDTMSLNSVKFYFKYNSDSDNPAYDLDIDITTQINYNEASYSEVVNVVDKSISYETEDGYLVLVFDNSIFSDDFNICNFDDFDDCSVENSSICEGDSQWEEGLGNGVWDQGEVLNSHIKDNVNIIIKNPGQAAELDLYSKEINESSFTPYVKYNFTNLNTNEEDSLLLYGSHNDKYLSDSSIDFLDNIQSNPEYVNGNYLINFFGNISASLSFDSADFNEFENYIIVDDSSTYLDIKLMQHLGWNGQEELDPMEIDFYYKTDANEYITKIYNKTYPTDNYNQEPHSEIHPSIRITPNNSFKSLFQNLLNGSINEVTFYIRPSGRYNNFSNLYFGKLDQTNADDVVIESINTKLQLVMQK